MIRYYLPVKLLLLVKIFLVCFVISLIIPACDQIDQKETDRTATESPLTRIESMGFQWALSDATH